MTEVELTAWLTRLTRIPVEQRTEAESRQWFMLTRLLGEQR